jgi:hypothetical protein
LQDCASPGDRCYPASTSSTEGQCFAAGAQGLGSPCTEPPVDAPAACGKGLLCVGADAAPGPGTCHALCVVDTGCPSGERCELDLAGSASVWGVCVPKAITAPPPCDAFAQDCAAGQMCVLTPAGASECVAMGSGASGASCAQLADCSPGLACAALDGTTPTSYWFSIDPGFLTRGGGTCLPLCSQPGAACGAGGVCAFLSGPSGDARTDAGVCYVPGP